MKLPVATLQLLSWGEETLTQWAELAKKTSRMQQAVGRGDAFQQEIARLQQLGEQETRSALQGRLHHRVTARALTWLWLENERFRAQELKTGILADLIDRQRPYLGIMALQHLIALYFQEFDRLDRIEAGLREYLENLLEQQLVLRVARGSKLPRQFATLHDLAKRLLRANGPQWLVARVRIENSELDQWLVDHEMAGLGDGRYGDLYRARYYLETLKRLPVGKDHELFSELLKPAVCKVDYEGRRLGHAVLELMIDRSPQDPGEIWRNFIMELAGDPRISSSASSFRQWWQPLGEQRIETVRSWLSSIDLRLFLRAVEEYGKEAKDEALQRMFPARQLFMEGLEKQNLIRATRLMLGTHAEKSITQSFDNRLKTHSVRLRDMPRQAVLYIDCGEFCLIEGSHNFTLRIYLAPPSSLVAGYQQESLHREDLTQKVPADYERQFGADAARAEIRHIPGKDGITWQRQAFEFLAHHGVALDIEQMLSKEGYRAYLRQFGLPEVRLVRTRLQRIA